MAGDEVSYVDSAHHTSNYWDTGHNHEKLGSTYHCGTIVGAPHYQVYFYNCLRDFMDNLVLGVILIEVGTIGSHIDVIESLVIIV